MEIKMVLCLIVIIAITVFVLYNGLTYVVKNESINIRNSVKSEINGIRCYNAELLRQFSTMQKYENDKLINGYNDCNSDSDAFKIMSLTADNKKEKSVDSEEAESEEISVKSEAKVSNKSSKSSHKSSEKEKEIPSKLNNIDESEEDAGHNVSPQEMSLHSSSPKKDSPIKEVKYDLKLKSLNDYSVKELRELCEKCKIMLGEEKNGEWKAYTKRELYNLLEKY